jgi:2-keto-4-pentenoate hydratase/2-oxohepta-3-ene-1,7-dioic acid hydratase in catechol pathway
VRTANLAGRLVLDTASGSVDVARASKGAFSPDPQDAFDCWDELCSWAASLDGEGEPFDESLLGPPVPRPRQVFAIGMNYASHADETGIPLPEFPSAFTKFPSSLGPPHGTVTLPSEYVDWEVELVAVIGRHAHNVEEADAWSYVAGLTVGQDLSERKVQMRPPVPQFSLGKSYPGFAPIGPSLVSVDEFEDPDNLEIMCTLNGDVVQHARTTDLIFSVPALIERLSSILPLLPGDLVFTGTPEGIGATRKPQRFLRAGDELISTIEGIGAMRTAFSEAAQRSGERAA